LTLLLFILEMRKNNDGKGINDDIIASKSRAVSLQDWALSHPL